MSRILTRTKIAVGVGLLGVAVVAVFFSFSVQPTVTVGSVSYNDFAISFSVTNRADSAVDIHSVGVVRIIGGIEDVSAQNAHSVVRVHVMPSPQDGDLRSWLTTHHTLEVRCYPYPGKFRKRIEALLRKIWITPPDKFFVVSMDLPPIDSTAQRNP